MDGYARAGARCWRSGRVLGAAPARAAAASHQAIAVDIAEDDLALGMPRIRSDCRSGDRRPAWCGAGGQSLAGHRNPFPA